MYHPLARLLGTAALLVTAWTAQLVGAYPAHRGCTGDCTAIDPAVVRRADGTYFRFITFDEIRIYSAPALVGPWTYQGAALEGGSSIDLAGNTDLWAPDVKLIGDTYVLYYSVSVKGSQTSATGYATSSTLEYGSWTDHGATGIASTSASAYNAIDASLLVDNETSTTYMTFGSYFGGIYGVPMNAAGTAVQSGGAYTKLAGVASTAATKAEEGSYLYQHGAYYYLFFSAGRGGDYNVTKPASGKEYHVLVCRSEAVAGPYVDSSGAACTDGGGDTLLASHGEVYGPGGQGVYEDPDHGIVLYYHYDNPSISLEKVDYQFGWNILTWSDGWPTVSS